MSDWGGHESLAPALAPSHSEGICTLSFFHSTEGIPNDEKQMSERKLKNIKHEGPNKKRIGGIEKIPSP